MGLLLVPFFHAHPQTIGDFDPEAMAIAIVTIQRLLSIFSELTVSALLARNS
jgi:hypothetical protein